MTAQLLLWLAAAAAAPVEGVVAGRLAIYEGRSQMQLPYVESVLRRRVWLTLRRGRRVYETQLDAEGFFAARLPAGRYRLEYLSLGEQAEVLGPQIVEVQADRLVCAGTLAIVVQRLESLGESNASAYAPVNDCARMMPYLKTMTGWKGATAVRLPVRAPDDGEPRVLSVADLLLGLRGEVAISGTELALRGWYVYPLLQRIGDPGAVTLQVSYAHLMGLGSGFGGEVSAGPGVNVLGLVELNGVAGVRLGFSGFPTEGFLAVILRAGFSGAGFDLRVQWTPVGPTLYVGVDVAPFFLVGSVL